MHRATPSQLVISLFCCRRRRLGRRQVDDTKLMQEMSGNFMKGETRSKVEAPQNYGFTLGDCRCRQAGSKAKAVAAPAGARGRAAAWELRPTSLSPAAIDRFPVAAVIDDRRHRLKGLGEGRCRDVRPARLGPAVPSE